MPKNQDEFNTKQPSLSSTGEHSSRTFCGTTLPPLKVVKYTNSIALLKVNLHA
jgi:hypothetical protein